jgi:hypothetical protein
LTTSASRKGLVVSRVSLLRTPLVAADAPARSSGLPAAQKLPEQLSKVDPNVALAKRAEARKL